MRAGVTRRRKKQSKRRRGEARSERVEATDFYASPRNKNEREGWGTREGERERGIDLRHTALEKRDERERKRKTLTASRGGAG